MADREFKSLPFTNLKAQASGRVRAGIASVFGNIDAAGERVMPGAFAKTIEEGSSRARHLWNHSWQHPPIATIKELRELTRAELPPEVLEKAPEATGGLLVKREYYDVELADWILQAIDSGDVNEMSFGYDVVRSSTVTEPVPGDPDNSREVRNLEELRIYDTSDVLWGCNAATVAAGAKNLEALPLGVIASHFVMVSEQIKAGRRNANSDQKLIDLIHETAVSLGAACNPDDDDADGKSDSEAGAGNFDTTPLSALKLRAAKLHISNLRNLGEIS
jgi:HK97 family phage prohead protease